MNALTSYPVNLVLFFMMVVGVPLAMWFILRSDRRMRQEWYAKMHPAPVATPQQLGPTPEEVSEARRRASKMESSWSDHDLAMRDLQYWLNKNPDEDIHHPRAQKILLKAVAHLNSYLDASDDPAVMKDLRSLYHFMVDDREPLIESL